MTKEDITFKLACAIIPGLMSRYGEPGYSDLAAIGEAFNLSFRYFDSVKAPNSETAESPATDRQHTQAKMPSFIECMSAVDAGHCDGIPNNEYSRGAKMMYDYIAWHFSHA